MSRDMSVKISWKYKDGADHYEQVFNGEDSVDKYIDIWMYLHAEGDNPLDYVDFFDIKLLAA